jgi:hypothetical protein
MTIWAPTPRADEEGKMKMKSALSLTLIVCLVASALPVTAQGLAEMPVPFDTRGSATPATAGPLARAVGEAAGPTPSPISKASGRTGQI